MTVKECYMAMQEDYETVIKRMLDDARIKKFLFMFLRDETFNNLCTAVDNGNYEDAFREAHTLKGLCQNMAFSDFFVPVDNLTELLRHGEWSDEALKQFELVKAKYAVIRKAIEELQNADI